MKITQGTFSFLPELTDAEIRAQIDYALQAGWAIGIEYTDDPHPRNCYWDMWCNPMFDLRSAAEAMKEILSCRESVPQYYIRVIAFDATRGFETTRLSFIVNRPTNEPGFRLQRQEVGGRNIRYSLESYAAREPEGRRYK